jgi:hypothetical protein
MLRDMGTTSVNVEGYGANSVNVEAMWTTSINVEGSGDIFTKC